MGSGERVPVVSVGSIARFYVKCEVCNLTPSQFGGGYLTKAGAKEAATKHREAHAAQPYCTCGTYPNLHWDDDEEAPEDGQGHCRHQGRCCECGCLTKTPRPAVRATPGGEE